MLAITEEEAHNCLVIEPSGELETADFAELNRRFDAMARNRERVPNLVINAKSFPGWASFAALFDHVRFIREHHRMIEKIALVSDARILEIAPRIAGSFVWAEVRRFSDGALEEALDWVAAPSVPAGQVVLMEELPDDVLGIDLRGAITARDYAQTIAPEIERMLALHEKIKLIYRVGPEFASFSPGAVWSDTRIGVMHLSAFSRVAVVSDLDWIRYATSAFAPLIAGEVHFFAADEVAEALAWITAAEAATAS